MQSKSDAQISQLQTSLASNTKTLTRKSNELNFLKQQDVERDTMEENKRKVEDKLEDLLMEQMNLKRDNAKLTKELQDKTSVLEEYERPGGLKEEILKLRATSTIPGA